MSFKLAISTPPDCTLSDQSLVSTVPPSTFAVLDEYSFPVRAIRRNKAKLGTNFLNRLRLENGFSTGKGLFFGFQRSADRAVFQTAYGIAIPILPKEDGSSR